MGGSALRFAEVKREHGGGMRVLVVEDEVRLAKNIAAGLREGNGYAVDVVHDGRDALHLSGLNNYDLIVMDLMLPGAKGGDVVRALRAARNTSPVLVLTAMQSMDETIRLLDLGVDDYMTKPFDLRELLARAKALIRRRKGVAHAELAYGGLTMHTGEQAVRYRDAAVTLSATEYRILETLLYHPRVLVAKHELLESIYDINWDHHSNVIEAHLSNLRKKLKQVAGEDLVETVRGRGYRMVESR